MACTHSRPVWGRKRSHSNNSPRQLVAGDFLRNGFYWKNAVGPWEARAGHYNGTVAACIRGEAGRGWRAGGRMCGV